MSRKDKKEEIAKLKQGILDNFTKIRILPLDLDIKDEFGAKVIGAMLQADLTTYIFNVKGFKQSEYVKHLSLDNQLTFFRAVKANL